MIKELVVVRKIFKRFLVLAISIVLCTINPQTTNSNIKNKIIIKAPLYN